MTLTPKTFDLNQKIRKKVYLPPPNIYAHVDLNQQAEIYTEGLERAFNNIGSFRQGINLTVNTLSLINAGSVVTPIYSLSWGVTLTASGTPYVWARKNKFSLATVLATPYVWSGSNTGGFTSAPPPNKVALWLTAKLSTVTFANDPVMSGVNGTGFPSALPAAETEVWSDEALVTITNDNFPALASGYYYICPILSIGYIESGTTPIKYTPILLRESPDITNVAAEVLDSLPNESLKTNSLLGVIERLVLRVRDLINQGSGASLDDTLLYQSPGLFRPTPINAIIRDRAHAFTKPISMATINYDPSGGWLSTSISSISIITGLVNAPIIYLPEDTEVSGIFALYIPPIGSFPAVFLQHQEGTILYLTNRLISGQTIPTVWNNSIFTDLIYPSDTMSVLGSWVLQKIGSNWSVKAYPDHLRTLIQNITTNLAAAPSYTTVQPAGTGSNQDYATSWGNASPADPDTPPLKFTKSDHGEVSIYGVAINNSMNWSTELKIFQLPLGFRPTTLKRFTVPRYDGANVQFLTVTITTLGEVSIESTSVSNALGSNNTAVVRVVFDGLKYHVSA